MIVVPVIGAGVVPPIAPGEGSDEVEPPKLTDVPAIVIAECARPELASDPFVTLLRFTTVSAQVFPADVASPVSAGKIMQESVVIAVNCLLPLVPTARADAGTAAPFT